MAETRFLPVIEEEEIDDDFYEKIEAPKFVDLTAPDLRLSDDDRRWFCLRVGCDQKHEEELDSEAIYKNFVLRVMEARSPNVGLRKALNRRKASENMKCPLTAPAKSSKSRVSRIALISSVSQKIIDNRMKVKPPSKVTANATPNAKVKQSSDVRKALTTPRNQNKVSNLQQFRTVQSKKATTTVVPKNRVVAKALVFHSPKKAIKAKSSTELNTPVRALCSAMKKLELNGIKKNEEGRNKSVPLAISRKQFRGREVKSRVFDSLYSDDNRKGQETNSMRCLKEKRAKDLQKGKVTLPREEAENDSIDMEIDEKTRGSLDTRPISETSGGHITSQSSSKDEENKTIEGSDNEERRNPVSEKGKNPEVTRRKYKEKSMASDDKENENDDKENASAPDENRVQVTPNDYLKKAIIGSKHEDSRKTFKKSTSAAPVSQVVKYRKLKPTNPKPFKLRTDERGILKEANLEKKNLSPSKETTVGGIQSAGFDKSNSHVQHKLSTVTPHRNLGLGLQKVIDPDNRLELQDKTAKKLDKKFERKSQIMQPKVVRTRGALSRKKEVLVAISGKHIVKPKEAATPRNNDVSPTSNVAHEIRGRRAITVPKEPKFHSLHVPKSCTRKMT